MRAMLLDKITSLDRNQAPLRMADVPVPTPGTGEVLIRLSVCGICHTELDETEGRTPPAFFPMIPGHQAIGKLIKSSDVSSSYRTGERVGVAWIYSACGECGFCREGRENLCSLFKATGRDAYGGYADYMVAPEKFIFRIPDFYNDAEAAPLLCAGAIGLRSIRLTELKDGENLGLSGFGASAHLVLKIVRHEFPNSQIYVFSRNHSERLFAKHLGAFWTGDFTDAPSEKLHKIIDTTPAWTPVIHSLANLEKGGKLVINAIRKQDSDKSFLQTLSYSEHLWLEKEIKTVANVTSVDVKDFLNLAATAEIKPEFTEFPLAKANEALMELKNGGIRGAKVLRINPD